jgi:pimeloyl-ACP methyl ester carboxylesterase
MTRVTSAVLAKASPLDVASPMGLLSYQGADGCRLYATTVGGDDKPPLILLHAGGPDHHSLLPLAMRLIDRWTVILPDLRGYGRSVCTDPARHTWAQYTDDTIGLAEHLGLSGIALGGAGLGSTITLRTAAAHPNLVHAAILIGVEDIEDDEAKQAEIRFMDDFAARVAADGIEAGWAPILADLPPVVGDMVRDAIPRSTSASIVAAAAIGRDRSFRDVSELRDHHSHTDIPRHRRTPSHCSRRTRRRHPPERHPGIGHHIRRPVHDLARATAPAIREFLEQITRTKP